LVIYRHVGDLSFVNSIHVNRQQLNPISSLPQLCTSWQDCWQAEHISRQAK